MPAVAIQSPTGGWNARDAFDEMKPSDAIELINWIPRSSAVESRRGSIVHSTGLGGPVETLVSYRDPQGDQLLCCAAGTWYNITVGLNVFPTYDDIDLIYDDAGYTYDGTPSPSLFNVVIDTGFTSSRWQTIHHSGVLIATNGRDTPQVYDGSTMTDITVTGDDPSSTAITAANLWGCNVFKGRAFYWEERKQFFWYAAAGAYQGALESFDLSGQIKEGGYLVYMLTWTLDSGDGVDDLAVFVFNTGEVVVYQGDDPQDANRWSRIGRFSIGEPLGIRSAEQVGGTQILATKDGYIDLSVALKDGRYSEKSVYSNKIIRAAKNAAATYGSLFGWECILYPAGNLFIVNVPQSNGDPIQHVRETSNGGWTQFQNWPAITFVVHRDELFFGTDDGRVFQADYGTSDDGEPITLTAIPAFSALGSRAQRKQLTAVQFQTNFRYPAYIAVDGFADFIQGGATESTLEQPPLETPVSSNLLLETRGGWRNVWADGYTVTCKMRIKTDSQQVIWYQQDYMFQNLGVV